MAMHTLRRFGVHHAALLLAAAAIACSSTEGGGVAGAGGGGDNDAGDNDAGGEVDGAGGGGADAVAGGDDAIGSDSVSGGDDVAETDAAGGGDAIATDSAGGDDDGGAVADGGDNDAGTPDAGATPDTSEPEDIDETKGLQSPELLVKILGPSGQDWIQSEGQKIQVSGVIFGQADSLEWETAAGASGTIPVDAYWVSGIIDLQEGDNVITVRAKNGSQTVEDSVRIVYNPLFSFEGKPDVRPDVVFVGESTKFVTYMRVTAAAPGGTVDPNSLQLIEVDSNGNEIKVLGKLNDNGQGSSCDDIQQDGLFSVCFTETPSSPKKMYVRVKATVTIFDKTYTAYSAASVVDVVPRFTGSECNAIVGLQKKVKGDYIAAVNGGTAPAQAQADAIAALQADASVAEAGPSINGHGVWVSYKSGRVGALNLAPAGLRAGGSAPDDGAAAALPTFSVGTRRALALAPFSSVFAAEPGAGDEAAVAADLLGNQECPPFQVDAMTGNQALLQYYRDMTQYGLVAITGHGDAYFQNMSVDAKKALDWEHHGAQEVIWSGEQVDCGKISSSTQTCSSNGTGCPAGQVCVQNSQSSGVCVDHTQGDIMTGRVVIGADTYGLTPTMLKRHHKAAFPDSIVYLGACRTLYNGSLAVQLYGNGAQAVVGYNDYVTNAFAFAQGDAFFTALVTDSKSVLQATDALAKDTATGGRMRILGNGKANVNNGSIINPSWDEGEVTGWKKEGDGRVISRLGSTIPVAGKFMGIISTGLGFTTQSGSLEQPFCIDASKTELCFFWRYYSEEFLEWCGSQFMDRFTAEVKGDAGKLTVTDVWVDQLCPYDCGGKNPCDPGSPSCKCGQQWKTLTASDVSFDQGGVYMTPWQKDCADVSPFAGKRVDLRFFNTDVGDSIYDTAVLIDEVTLK